MPIIILHGNGLSAISQKISTIKKGFDPSAVVEVSGKSVSFEQALIGVSTPGLFSEKRFVLLEDFSEGDVDLEKLPKDEDLTLVFKFTKNLAANSVLLKNASKVGVQVINLKEEMEVNIFPYLDLLAEKNPKALEQIDYRLGEHGGQYLLTMFFYMLRRMVQRPKSSSSFMIQKLEVQKRNFPLEKITKLYREVIETDFKIKSGLIEEKLGLTLLVGKIIN